jgi:hypothetical protein
MAELRVRKRRPPTEELIDESIKESFPASDPPAVGRSERPGAPKPDPKSGADKAKPEE